MGVVIKLSTVGCMLIEGNRLYLAFVITKRKYTSDCVVGADDWMQCQVEMLEAQHSSEGPFEQSEHFLEGICPIPGHVLACETSKRGHHVDNKSSVKVGKSKEGLDVLDTSRHWPILDNLNL